VRFEMLLQASSDQFVYCVETMLRRLRRPAHTTSGTSLQPGSITPSVTGDLMVSGAGFDQINTFSISAGWSTVTQRGFDEDVNNQGIAFSYRRESVQQDPGCRLRCSREQYSSWASGPGKSR
jgi:hypothetical protein